MSIFNYDNNRNMKKIFYKLFVFLLLFNCSDFSKKYDLVEIEEVYLKGNIELAQEQLNTYISQHKNNEYAWTLHGHMYSDLYEFENAKENYKKALKINPKTVEAITGLGIVARLEGDFDKAENYYLDAIKIDSDYGQAYSSLVGIMLNKRNFKLAVEYGQKGYNLDNGDPIIASNLAVAYHYFGDLENRDKYFEIAKKLGYDDIETLQDIFEGKYSVFE